MPWIPELFSAPVLQEILDRRRQERMRSVPYFDGFVAGEPQALLESFAGDPELYDPANGRVKGEAAFRWYVGAMSGWLAELHVEVEDISRVILAERGCEEDVLHLDGPHGRVALPVAILADHADDRLAELRIYHSTWQLTGRHVVRQPLLQPDPELAAPDAVGDLQQALAAGDLDAVVAAFEPDGTVRDPAGAVHRDVRAYYERVLAGGGLPHQPCAVLDDGRICAVEYVVARTPPQAGVAVHERGPGGRLAAVRIYDDTAFT